MKDLQHEAEDAVMSCDEIANLAKENERKLKALEAELLQTHEDLNASEKAHKNAESERDELQEQLNSGAGAK